jgi:WD40 repeat protein
MKRSVLLRAIFLSLLAILAYLPKITWAEDKPVVINNVPSGQGFAKLPKTPNDPVLTDAHVYPLWGPICQRYTYSVIYRDQDGRQPEYVRMYFNGAWIDLEKENPANTDYQKGVKYIYKFVPKKIGANFYFFEASNGLGKARAGIIDSPDNGPVLFESAFEDNEIVFIDAATGQKVWSYPVGKEWVGGVALSDDGKYLAAQTSSRHVYLFETGSAEPKWAYTANVSGLIGGDVKGGIDISADGSKVFALLGNRALLFSKDSHQPLWEAPTGNGGYNAAISSNGEYLAVATAGSEEDENTNLLILWHKDSPNRLWQYHSSGNFHDVSFSADGSLLAAATGCPDRRAYLFSKDSAEPLWRSEMLTRDSPVHQAKISADGEIAAFGAESGDGALHLFFQEAGKIVWKFPAPGRYSFRALNITPDGEFIGGATTVQGQAFIFSKDSATPLASWQVDASLGAADLADDGSFLAVGGTDNKVHIFERESKKERAEISLNEFVGELDISANGQYLAAGTSGSVYFFESLAVDQPETECEEIIEPVPESEMIAAMVSLGEGSQPKSTYYGNGVCESPPEDATGCPQDCDPNFNRAEAETKRDKDIPGKWPGMIFGLGFLTTLLGLGGYLVVVKADLLRKKDETGGVSASKFNPKVVISLTALAGLFLVLTIVSVLLNRQVLTSDQEQGKFQKEGRGVYIEESRPDQPDQEEAETVPQGACGNTICEPDLGETLENCPRDCSFPSD